MALVHQRFKRIFYAFPNPITGALGSVYRLHGEKSLNHHYSVFRIKVPEAYLYGSSDSSEKCLSNIFFIPENSVSFPSPGRMPH